MKFLLRKITLFGWSRAFFRQLFSLPERACRFQPTCSVYAACAIERYGILKGSWLTLKRFIRCHPWSQGGADPVK